MSATQTYDRIRAACCPHHGLGRDETLELHARAIAQAVLAARGELPTDLFPRSLAGDLQNEASRLASADATGSLLTKGV